jgi:hypothetical protein
MYFFVLLFNNILFFIKLTIKLPEIYNHIKEYIIFNDMTFIINNIDYNINEDNDEIIYENIIRIYPDYFEKPIYDNKYYIGLCVFDNDNFIVNSLVPIEIFFKYNYSQLLDYLISFSCMENNWERIEILKIRYVDYQSFIIYSTIIKTFYLKILQRKWKNYLQRRNKYVKSSKIINDLRKREYDINFKLGF